MSSLVVLILFLIDWSASTTGIYSNVWDCTPPSFDQSYMGGPPQKGNQLTLFINDTPLNEFKGYSSSESDYKLKIKSEKDWYQYAIFINKGTLFYFFCLFIACI